MTDAAAGSPALAGLEAERFWLQFEALTPIERTSRAEETAFDAALTGKLSHLSAAG